MRGIFFVSLQVIFRFGEAFAVMLLTELYKDAPVVVRLKEMLKSLEQLVSGRETRIACQEGTVSADSNQRLFVKGVSGSVDAAIIAAVSQELTARNHLVVASSKEEA